MSLFEQFRNRNLARVDENGSDIDKETKARFAQLIEEAESGEAAKKQQQRANEERVKSKWGWNSSDVEAQRKHDEEENPSR